MNQPSSTTSSTSNDSPAAHAEGSQIVRFAVVQLEYQPAFKNLLFEPLLPLDPEKSSLLPPTMHAAPQALQTRYNELRRRIRDVYAKVHQRKIEAILEACKKKWKVNLVVFPEYSIPPELLSSIARNAGDMVVVAGSHYVDRETLKRRMYEPLDGQRHEELLQQSVSPILHSNRLLKLVSKLHPAKPELGTMKPGSEWEPVENLPSSIPGPMGVLICLDYTLRQSNQHIEHIAKPLGDCRFLVAPARTNEHSLDEMMAQALKDARRDHKPVFFANDGLYGGTTIMVDEERPRDLTMFPEHVGRLEAREEGIIVADVDLALERRGPSTPYELTPLVTPLLAASFVYRGIERKYAQWLDAIHEKLDAPNKSDFDKLEDIAEFVKSNTPPLPGKTSARQRRLERLTQEVEHESSLERIRQWTTELVFPENILPMSVIWAALAQGAAKEVARWVPQVGDFGVVRDKLRERYDKLERGMNEWAETTRHAAVDIVNEVAGEFMPRDPKAQMPIVDVYEGDIHEGFEEDKKEASRLYEEGRFADARVIYRRMLTRAETMLEKAISEEVSERPKPRNWVATFRLNVALASLNLQEITEAREFLAKTTTDDLDAVGRMHFAEAVALVGQLERARAVLPPKTAIPEKHHRKYDEVVQSLDLLDGRLPAGELVSDMVRLRAAPILLDKGDRFRVAEYCLGILKGKANDALMTSFAAQFLTEALRRTIIEMPGKEGEIPAGTMRGEIIETLEKHFADFQRDKLPELARASDRRVEAVFRTLMDDKDWTEDQGAWFTEDAKTFEKPDDARNLAFRLANEGRLDEALRILPNDHPWGSRLDRVELLLMGKRNAQALEETLALAKEFPDRATIEGQAAELLHRNGQIKEALEHAQRAFEQLPSIGYRLHYVDLLDINGDARAAWDLLKGFETDKRPGVMRARAVVAEKLGLLAEAESAWGAYVERRPKDGHARVHFAELLFMQHQPEKAAVVAWSVFREQGDRLGLDALFACGRLQRLSGELSPEQERRIKEVAAKVHERFPGEAKAEAIRLHLLTMLGAIPADVPRIEFELLNEEHGFQRFVGDEGQKAVIDIFTQQRKVADIASQLQREGAIPVATACALGGARLPLFVIRILKQSPYQAGLLCPPVSLLDRPPAIQLNGATLLVSDLELLLLEALKLIPALRSALGETGRVKLFEYARDRIVNDAVQLRLAARPDELAKKESLLRQAERIPVLEADPNAPMDDAAAVRRANAVLVDELRKGGVDDGTERISSRSFLQSLRERGVLDDEQYKSVLAYYAETSDPLAALPDPLTKLLVLPRFFLERLHDIDALDKVMMSLRSVLRLEPTALLHWRHERDELVNEIDAHKLADKVHQRLAEGWIEVLSESPVADMPALREPSDAAETLVLEPLQEMLAYRAKILENPAWWRLTAEYFGSAHLGERETVRQFVWESPEQYLRLVQRLRQAATRDLTFPMLVRLLVQEEKDADAVLLKLAELGFPDALGAGELLRLEKRFGGLEKEVPKRILEHQEWMAREPSQLGAGLARMRLAQTYAATIFESFLTADGTSLPRTNLMDVLLRRQEDIGRARATTILDHCFTFLIARTLDQWSKAWADEGEHLVSDENSPIVALWARLRLGHPRGGHVAPHIIAPCGKYGGKCIADVEVLRESLPKRCT